MKFNVNYVKSGSGKSHKPSQNPHKTYTWNFDDHLRDVDAILNCVLKISNANQAHWIGHSMGRITWNHSFSRHSHSILKSDAVYEK